MGRIVKKVWRKRGEARLAQFSVVASVTVKVLDYSSFPDNAWNIVLVNYKTCIIRQHRNRDPHKPQNRRYTNSHLSPLLFLYPHGPIRLHNTTLHLSAHCETSVLVTSFFWLRCCITRTDCCSYVTWLWLCDLQGMDWHRDCECLCCWVLERYTPIYSYATKLEICKNVWWTYTRTQTSAKGGIVSSLDRAPQDW
jgi:hypothetical protein